MGSRRTHEDWPAFAQTRDGITLVQVEYRWPRLRKSNGTEYSEITLRLKSYDSTGTDYGSNLGTLRLTRELHTRESDAKRVLRRAFHASLRPWNGTVPINLGIGRCATWEEAVETASECMDVVGAIRAWGKELYAPVNWRPIRPFKVVYPWRNPREPNAIYSPFKLIGDYRLDEVDNSCVVMSYLPSLDQMKVIAEQHGANALLVEEAGQVVVYHRPNGQMSASDPITLEQFYARVLAGSEEDGYSY